MKARQLLAVYAVVGMVAASVAGFAVGTWAVSAADYRVIGPYFMPIDLGKLPTDAKGIPMVQYDASLQYNPTIIAGQAIGFYGQWLQTGSASDKELFLKYCDWLVSHQQDDGRWLYTFQFGTQPVPWWSALAQGHAIAALARAFSVTGDSLYQTAARMGLNVFTKPQADGGVTSNYAGHVWYEEYLPTRRPHTLNGFMFALLDLWDYHLVFNDSLSETLWDTGIATLVSELPRFEIW